MSHLSKRHLLLGSLAIVLTGAVGTAVWTSQRLWSRQGGWEERPLEGLNSFGAVPNFSLIERSGKHMNLSDFKGKLWVANFICTTCKETCPLQSAEMAKLQEDLGPQQKVVLVSISVDPERDDPRVLSRYAGRFKADPDRWLFLTSERRAIYRLAQESFRLSAVPASEVGQESGEILHSSRFVLVNGKAEIKGYYDSRDSEALQRLRRDLKTLLRRDKA